MSPILDSFNRWYWEMNAKRILSKRPSELIGDGRSYSRFIILAHQRSGSSMVAWTLNQHPQIVSFGELFVQGRIGHMVDGFDSHSEALLHLRGTDPIRFLEEHAFSGYAEGIGAAGFKLFPDHLDNPETAPVLDWLTKDNNIKIISLTRKNLLDVYCSLMIANKTGVFGIHKPSERQHITIEVDPIAAEKEFKKRIAYQQQTRAQLVNHEFVDLTYEEMIKDLPVAFERMQRFVGVDVQPLPVTTVKQETRTLEQIIENYDELRTAWRGTEWEEFLT